MRLAPEADAFTAAPDALRQRVLLYIEHVLTELTSFEDSLLSTDGFFARECHFEARIEAIRTEFEANARAQSLFSTAPAVSLLIWHLTDDTGADADADLDADAAVAGPDAEVGRPLRRRMQRAFAAAVLLSSSIAVSCIVRHPPLLQQLWRFLERPAPLHYVQLHYWCRCTGTLLLSIPGSDTDVGPQADGIAAATRILGRDSLLRGLVRHLESDAVCLLLKCVLGVGAESGVSDIESTLIPIATAIHRGGPLMASCMEVMMSNPDAAENAGDVLCCLCEAVMQHPNAPRLLLLLAEALVPQLDAALVQCLDTSDAAPSTPIVAAVTQVACVALSTESRSVQVEQEQRQALPFALLSPVAAEGRHPFSALIRRHLDDLRKQLRSRRAAVQLNIAKLLHAFFTSAPQQLRRCDELPTLLTTVLDLFFQRDSNGGGRQDFLRNIVLDILRTLLSMDDEDVSHALLVDGELVHRLWVALDAPELTRCSPEHCRLLAVDVVNAATFPSVSKHLHCTVGWRHICKVATGSSPAKSPARPISPLAEIPLYRDPLLGPDSPMPPPLLPPIPQHLQAVLPPPPPISTLYDLSENDSSGAADDEENVHPNTAPCVSPSSIPGSGRSSPTSPLSARGKTQDKQEGLRRSPRHGADTRGGEAAQDTPTAEGDAPVETAAHAEMGPAANADVEHPPGAQKKAQLLVVDSESLRCSEDFSKLTPQPKLVGRQYYRRKAKDSSPFGRPLQQANVAEAEVETLSATVKALSF